MPFTANRQFRDQPRLLESAQGLYYQTPDGRRLLDGAAGLWCVNAGHCRPAIVEAIQRTAAHLDYAPPFQFGHPASFRLADALVEQMPDGLDHIFFTNSGSESVETALKIALAFHRVRGEAQRVRLIGRERGYHGTNFGGLSVGGMVANRRAFGVTLPFVDHLRHTWDAEHRFNRGQPELGAHLADDLMRLIDLHGSETIAAVIVEPVACSTGVLVPPVGYLERLREITAAHGILLIFDEVITAFGRLGQMTAAQRFGVTPDLITMAKGLTNGAVPMGAVAVHGRIHEAFMSGPRDTIELFHGYTYSAHPLACAAALAALEIYAGEQLFERAQALEQRWETAAHGLAGLPGVRDVRQLGLVAGIELEPDLAGPTKRAARVLQHCFDNGLLIRTTGDTIALSPPLILSERELDTMFDMVAAAIGETI
jgi:beta-alanine--pyruvate transaminase